jgi:outer membrane immunogenic protein
MKKLLTAFTAIAALTAPALAADMAPRYTKAPPLPVAVFTWTGCYIGGDVGGGSQRQSASEFTIPVGFNAGPTAITHDPTGVIGGVYAGCNYQFAGGWVVGAEGDWSATSLSHTATAPNTFLNGLPVGSGGVTYTESVKWLASIRGRLGYAVVPNMLLYVTGGAAWAHSDFSGVDAYSGGCPNCSVTGGFNTTASGWVVGGGVDWAPWSNNWIVRAEALFYSLNGVSALGFQQGTTTPATTLWTWGRNEILEGRVGIAYKF